MSVVSENSNIYENEKLLHSTQNYYTVSYNANTRNKRKTI